MPVSMVCEVTEGNLCMAVLVKNLCFTVEDKKWGHTYYPMYQKMFFY